MDVVERSLLLLAAALVWSVCFAEDAARPIDAVLYVNGSPTYLKLMNSTALEKVYTCVLDNSQKVEFVVMSAEEKGMKLEIGGDPEPSNRWSGGAKDLLGRQQQPSFHSELVEEVESGGNHTSSKGDNSGDGAPRKVAGSLKEPSEQQTPADIGKEDTLTATVVEPSGGSENMRTATESAKGVSVFQKDSSPLPSTADNREAKLSLEANSEEPPPKANKGRRLQSRGWAFPAE